jgi:hypothetical protein
MTTSMFKLDDSNCSLQHTSTNLTLHMSRAKKYFTRIAEVKKQVKLTAAALTEGQDARLGPEKVDELEKAHAVAKQDHSNTLREVVAELRADG